MRPRRRRIVPPPGQGSYGRCEVVEGISEEEKAGRPVAPLVELRPAGPPLEFSEALSEEEKAGRPVAPAQPGPAADDTDRFEREMLLAAVGQLTPATRAVFELALRGMRTAEIAAALGENEQLVANRLHAARKRLAEILRDLGAPQADESPPGP